MGLLLCILRRLKTWAVPLIALVLVMGAFGFVTSEGRDCRSLAVWLDALYRSLQMFGLSFDLDAERAARPNIVLELARYAAGFLIFAGVLTLLGRSLFTGLCLLWRTPIRRNTVVVLGYGLVGQAIARRLAAGGAAVVAVELRPGRDMRSIAENDDVLLIEGDASNADFLRHGIGLCRAKQVYLSLSTDMQTLDAVGIAAAVAKQSPQPASLRAFYNDQKSAGCRPLCSRVACFLLRL